jgi:hypothetical protein
MDLYGCRGQAGRQAVVYMTVSCRFRKVRAIV